MRKYTEVLIVSAVVFATIIALAAHGQAPDPKELIKRADKLFAEKNYKDACRNFEQALETGIENKDLHHASEHVILCKLRLSLFDDALAAAESYVKKTANTYHQARSERLAGNLYLQVPHWGTRAGGKFHRAQYKQGIRLRSYTFDKKHAVQHLETARDLYTKYDAAGAEMPKEDRDGWHNERIECLFDLASAVSRFTIYENNWEFWYRWWGDRDDETAETAGEEDFEEYHSRWNLQRTRPIGLRLDKDGNPIFPFTPKKYASDLDDDGKILYLLAETRTLDKTEDGKYTGLSYYRQAMLARARFGMDRLNNYAGYYWHGGKYPLKKELEDFNPWELKDNEALVLAGGRIRKVTLPTQFDVLSLLRVTSGDYAKSGVGDQSQYATGLYYQTRQQYLEAIAEYDRLEKAFPTSTWAGSGRAHKALIRKPQVTINQMGVQL
ncbi:hypothetical protein ACFL01_03465, partial [Planctomycetota bacterium]